MLFVSQCELPFATCFTYVFFEEKHGKNVICHQIEWLVDNAQMLCVVREKSIMIKKVFRFTLYIKKAF